MKPDIEPRCLARGCGETRLLTIDTSAFSGVTHVYCNCCGHMSFFAPPKTCGKCSGIGSHEAGCEELGKV